MTGNKPQEAPVNVVGTRPALSSQPSPRRWIWRTAVAAGALLAVGAALDPVGRYERWQATQDAVTQAQQYGAVSEMAELCTADHHRIALADLAFTDWKLAQGKRIDADAVSAAFSAGAKAAGDQAVAEAHVTHKRPDCTLALVAFEGMEKRLTAAGFEPLPIEAVGYRWVAPEDRAKYVDILDDRVPDYSH